MDSEQLDTGRIDASPVSGEQPGLRVHVVGARDWIEQHQALTRLLGIYKEAWSSQGEGDSRDAVASGNLEGDFRAERDLLLQGREGYSLLGESNETGGTQRPLRSCRGHPVRRYSPATVDELFSDDDSASSGYLEPTSTDQSSRSSDSTPRSSDIQVASESDRTWQDDDTLGSTGCGEDILRSSSIPRRSNSEPSRRLKRPASRTHGDSIRRLFDIAFAKNGANTSGGSGSAEEHSHPVYVGSYSFKPDEDLHDE